MAMFYCSAPLHFEPYSSMDIQSGQITPASSVHQDMQSVAAATSGTPPAVPDTKAKALPPMPESASEEHLRSVDQQLQDLSVKRNSREMVPQTDNSKPVDHHGAAAADSKDDAVMTAIQQVEEMLSVEDMSNEAQAEKRRSISLSPAQQPEKPQSSPQQEAAVVPAPAIVPTTEQQNESTTTTTTTTAAAAANNDASISASPDEPPAPATPPLQAQVAERAEEQKKETSSSPQPAATASTTLAAVVPSLEDKDRSNPEEISKETDLRFKPVPNPAFKGSDGNDANITRVDSGSDLNVKVDDQNRATPPKETTKLNNFAPGAVAAAATVAHGDNAANATAAADVPTTTTKTTTISPPAITTTATTPTTVPATITGKKNDTEEDGSEKDYPLPPPKAEKWVISSIRRPQQLPVRAQNARMSMFSTPTPPIGIPAADPEPAASVSTGNKFHRPNAPFKIEIPNKSQSTSSQQQPAATRANAGVNNSYQAPQAAAQQVIAAGRAHAHQTSSWQSPVNSSLSRRYSSIDRYHISDRPIPTDPVAVASANAIYEDDISREDTTAEQKASDVAHSNSVGKKNNLSSFMKGVLKHDNNNGSSHSSSNNNNGLRPASEKSNYNKSHLQPTSSVSNDGSKKEKRFSMNIFKKEKKQHKQPEDPIYEDVIVSAAAAAAPALDDSNYASAPIRPLSTSMTPVSRPSSAMGGSMSGGAGGGRPMSMAYPPPSQQQPPPQPLPQQQQQQQLLDDGTVVLEYVHAIWSYEAKISTEMNFMAGDVFAVIHKQMDNWWLVELMDPQRRQRGLVPGNYMESHQ
ncbi:hypothetical protein BDB00DRAFT_297213 [Zychaea mexicana]|uniref:uncharacterized protein n=1 Tax=Zychaea mexicana TaxID=64656 RepID=UPI0022FE61DC|nr:uncharacterized protein BDB00DRAFT_297213 [Zychaea mexicana]KAI9494618.1 hypothetical protein BDB00DRAFT_297213 [Zychaea mexicana]